MFKPIKVLATLTAIALVCGTLPQLALAKTVVKISFNQSEAHPQYKAIAAMGAKLKEQTKGEYEIEIHPNALLGDQRATAELVQSGAIQMAMVANSIVENYNKDFAVIGLPYVYDSVEHQKKVFTSGVLDELFATTAPHGFEVLTALTAGARCVYTTKPITTPDDLKGLKFRVMQSDSNVKMMNQMGGVGAPMAQGEVYTAIQQKVIDGGENNEITYADLKHYEIAPHFSYTRHLMIPDLLIANTDFLDSMSKEHRALLKKLIVEMTAEEFRLWDENITPAKKMAQDAGATFHDIDIKPFQARVQPLIDETVNKNANSKKVYASVRALAN